MRGERIRQLSKYLSNISNSGTLLITHVDTPLHIDVEFMKEINYQVDVGDVEMDPSGGRRLRGGMDIFSE